MADTRTSVTLERRGKPTVTGTPEEIAGLVIDSIDEAFGKQRKGSDAVIEKAAERAAEQPRLDEPRRDAVEAAGIAADRLRSLVERIERLEDEKRELAGDIKEVFAEAKGAGFDTKIMRQVVRLRKLESDDRQEQETLLDLYKQALGML